MQGEYRWLNRVLLTGVALLLLAAPFLWAATPQAAADALAPVQTTSSPTPSPDPSSAPGPSASSAGDEGTAGGDHGMTLVVAATVTAVAGISWFALRRISRREDSST